MFQTVDLPVSNHCESISFWNDGPYKTMANSSSVQVLSVDARSIKSYGLWTSDRSATLPCACHILSKIDSMLMPPIGDNEQCDSIVVNLVLVVTTVRTSRIFFSYKAMANSIKEPFYWSRKSWTLTAEIERRIQVLEETSEHFPTKTMWRTSWFATESRMQ